MTRQFSVLVFIRRLPQGGVQTNQILEAPRSQLTYFTCLLPRFIGHLPAKRSRSISELRALLLPSATHVRWQKPLLVLVFLGLAGLMAGLTFNGGSLASWDGGRPAQAWASAQEGAAASASADDGLLGIPFVHSMPEETLPQLRDRKEVELGISQLEVARVDCWSPCKEKAACRPTKKQLHQNN